MCENTYTAEYLLHSDMNVVLSRSIHYTEGNRGYS
jgi:hypothetical protein